MLRTYTVEHRSKVVQATPRLLQATREPKKSTGSIGEVTANVSPDGLPIIEKSPGRNVELTSIAGRLHDGSRDLSQLYADLSAINQARCQPELPEREVSKIARSIHGREPCRAGASQGKATDPEVLEVLAGCERELEGRAWPGVGPKSERSIYATLIKLSRRHGTRIPAGVRVSVSVRELAVAAATSKRTIENRLANLMAAGLIRRDGRGSCERAGAFVLLTRDSPRAEVGHSTHSGGYEARGLSVLPLRAPRLRWSAPGRLRLGKTCEAILDILESRRFAGSATIDELAEALHVRRVRDFKRRNIARLEERGIVEVSGSGASAVVTLVADWLEAVDRDREVTGEIDAYRRDVRRYNEQREAYRNRDKVQVGTRYLGAGETVDAETGEVRKVVVDEGFEAGGDVSQAEMDARREEPDTEPAAEFVAEELAVASGVRLKELYGRWAETGGNKQDLWDVIKAGPYTLHKEEMDFDRLYVYRRGKSPREVAA